MPLDTTVRHYTSSMNGASFLNNTANSLIQVLDAVLVNGFGNVTLTSLTVTNNIATANVSTGYNVAPYCVVTIAGATPSGLNGDKKVLSSGNVVNGNTTTFTFDATGVANGAATGTITCRFPGAGWTKPYANTTANVAVYRNSTNGTGLYLRVQDNSTTMAAMIGYESMTDVDTGTNPFPLTSQSSTGFGFYKATGTNRKWWIVADSKTCYVGVAATATADSYCLINGFGDFKSVRSSDPYCYFIVGRTTTADVPGGVTGIGNFLVNTYDNGNSYRIMARRWNGIVRSKYYSNLFLGYNLSVYGLSGAVGGFTFPSLVDNSLYIVPIYLFESSMFRGQYRGLYATPQNINSTDRFLLDNEVINDMPSVGKVCLYKALSIDVADPGCVFVDVAGPWE